MSDRGRSQDRALSQERETPFSGYGDRVGSGVAYAPAQWRGGELVTDPTLVTKSLKPRRFYYAPIGDGVVAADGVELKRLPPDLSPKVEVIQQRVVEKGPPGKPGLKVVEKTWTTGGGDQDSILNYGGQQIPIPQPMEDRGASQQRPADRDPFANLGDQLGPPNQRPASAQSAPMAARNGGGPPMAAAGPPREPWGTGPPRDAGPAGPGLGMGSGPAHGGPSAAPVGGIGSTRSTPGIGITGPATTITNGTINMGPPSDFPGSGRSSASLYEPGYRYEIKKDYKVTNPRELIHQYATTTPVTTIDPTLSETTRTITRQHYTQTVEESFGPFPPYTAGANVPSPLKFARQLRDETMTDSQRQANRQQQPMSANAKDAQFEQRIEEIRRSTSRQMSPRDPVMEQLSNQMQGGLKY